MRGASARARQHLLIFTRAPQLGRVKRRLARDVGAVEAARFARCTLAALLRRLAQDPRWLTALVVTPDRERTRWRVFGPRALMPQGRGDLGRRMDRALRRPPPGPVVLIGSDIPGIRAADIAEAFRLARRHGAVFGPATDGGYWLVGARRTPRLGYWFGGVRWSGPHALADTLANLDSAPGFAATLDDVDDGEALRRSRLAPGRSPVSRRAAARAPAAAA